MPVDGEHAELEQERDRHIQQRQGDEYLERTERPAVDKDPRMGQVLDADFGDHARGQEQKDELAGERRINTAITCGTITFLNRCNGFSPSAMAASICPLEID